MRFKVIKLFYISTLIPLITPTMKHHSICCKCGSSKIYDTPTRLLTFRYSCLTAGFSRQMSCLVLLVAVCTLQQFFLATSVATTTATQNTCILVFLLVKRWHPEIITNFFTKMRNLIPNLVIFLTKIIRFVHVFKDE